MLVVDVQRWRHPLGEHPGPEPARGLLGDTPPEDELHMIGTTDVEVLADHLLEEDAARQGPIQNLGQGELCLKDRQIVSIASRAIFGAERMGQPCQPFAEQSLDLVSREAVAKLLEPSRVHAGKDAVIQSLEGDSLLGQLSLDILMTVDA